MSFMKDFSGWPPADVAGALTGIAGDGHVRTPCGPRRLEFVRPGDLIVTRDNGLQPVRAIWTHQISDTAMHADPLRAPVRLAARAIGPMMPQRPLTLAPDHRILVPSYLLCDVEGAGGLMEARGLAGTSDEAYFDRNSASQQFYNLVFDKPQVVLINGLPVETFHVCPETLGNVPEDSRIDLLRQFPALRGKGQVIPALQYPAVSSDDYLPGFA